ncbi:putative mitochondrial group I intron splicing factor CCM1 [[Candida] railenensis]|uniref:Mitochondrial 15S rRNA processing factor CCM1 n=1 Tax=[Candida] railenensis TaxID=45579 RepID=A0A9P0QLM5_9ASCO|nr:putative mitochondrial group I intron splicing factor CCM1 [[Candida] railenensis]
MLRPQVLRDIRRSHIVLPSLSGCTPRHSQAHLYSTKSIAKPNGTSTSNVKAKLTHYVETGQIIAKSPKQYETKAKKIFKKTTQLHSNYSKQKLLLVLQSNYDGKLQNSKGELIKLRYVKASDLRTDSPVSKEIFHGLLEMARISKQPVNKKIMLSMLDISLVALSDPFKVTWAILDFLQKDNDAVRATWLARAATSSSSNSRNTGGDTASVGMNEIMKFHLEKGNVKEALKSYNDRKKWNIQFNNQTYIILFDGLARAHAFGGMPDSIANRAIEIFESFMMSTLKRKSVDDDKKVKKTYQGEETNLKCSIEHFNSCLNLVSRNFSNDQALMWSFFDILIPDKSDPGALKYQQLYPNIATYTTMINGVKKFCQSKSKLVLEDRQMKKDEKTLRLLEINAKLVSTAELILEKVIKESTPPTPPTKEETVTNPEVLVTYKQSARKHLVEIDETFVATFVSCFINNSQQAGSTNYVYSERGLKYLSMWCPEVAAMLKFVSGQDINMDIKSNELVVKSESERLKSAESFYMENPKKLEFLTEDGKLNDIFPEIVASTPLDESKVNPLVIFPPPILSKNKTKALYSRTTKRLVDFTRPSLETQRAIFDHKQFVKSRGKFGKKLPISMNLSSKLDPINRYVYGLALDGLLNLGLFKEFYLGVWYGLSKWGGLDINVDNMAAEALKTSSSQDLGPYRGGLLPEDEYCQIKNGAATSSTSEVFTPSQYVDRFSKDIEHKESIIDVLMIENFMYKMNESCPGRISPSKLAVELINALINPDVNIAYSLLPRYKTIDSIFAILTKELYHIKDSNYQFNRRKNEIAGGIKNTARKSLNKQQLNDLSNTLIKLMDSLVVKIDQEKKKNTNLKHPADLVVQKQFVESYVNFLKRINAYVWPQDDESFLVQTHIRILRSGIAMFMPKPLIDTRKELIAHSNEGIQPSMDYIINEWNSRNDLNSEQAHLLKWLKIVSKFEGTSEDKIKGLLQKIRESCDKILSGKAHETSVKGGLDREASQGVDVKESTSEGETDTEEAKLAN